MSCMVEVDQNVCPHCGYARGTAPREAFHLIPESILAGRYIVGKVLGFGGFGVTYIGYDAQLERVVAIKEFFPTSFATRMPGNTDISVYGGKASEQFGFGLERFIDEAKRLARFNGVKGITDIYDTFVQNNTAYIIMEFLKGHDVKQILSSSGRLDYETARKIILSICDTLAPVHAENIIHRDISPDNIYILDSGEIKLLDFGAARYESSANSKSLSVILKSGYAPEEQYRARGDQGSWTDVYALAATFYKMLTGVTPPDSMERAINDEIKEPSKLGATLPQSAENAIMNALNVRKEYRTATVDEFKNQLLSDGVERTKIKKKGANTGKMPLVGKIVIGVAAVAVVSLVTLQLTGVLNIAQNVESVAGAVTGTTTPTSAPAVIGFLEADAVTALTEAGYTVEFEPVEYSESHEKGAVITQSMPVDGVITLKICGGDEQDQLDTMIGMTAEQAAATLFELDSYRVEFVYDFNDTVAIGNVVGLKKTSSSNYDEVTVSVSLGSEGGTNEGIYTSMLYAQSYSFGYDDYYDISLFAGFMDDMSESVLQYSIDNENWYRATSAVNQYNYESDIRSYKTLISDNVEFSLVNRVHFDIPNLPTEGTFYLRLQETRDGEPIEVYHNIPQTITYSLHTLEKIGVVTDYHPWDEVDEMVANGEIEDYYADRTPEERAQESMLSVDYGGEESGYRVVFQGDGWRPGGNFPVFFGTVDNLTIETGYIDSYRTVVSEYGDIHLDIAERMITMDIMNIVN